MASKWKAVMIPAELYEKAKEYYEENGRELRLRHGIRSLSAFISHSVREYFKEKGII